MRAEDVHILPEVELSDAAMCGLGEPLRATLGPELATCTECRARWRLRYAPGPPLTDGDLVT